MYLCLSVCECTAFLANLVAYFPINSHYFFNSNNNRLDTLLFNRILQVGKRCIDIETTAINKLSSAINEDFVQCVWAIRQCGGRIVLTGMGKSALIAQKIAATFNSTGTPALFMHAADALHGDLGMIQSTDIAICLSKSGETPEIKALLPILKSRCAGLVAIVGNTASFLARQADFVLNTSVEREACPNNLAPTASTTAQMVMGDALAVCVLELREFSATDFGRLHPGGMLGKQLYLRIDDICEQNPQPIVRPETDFRQVIVEISANRMGATAVLDADNNLIGIITDGDVRRALGRYESFEEICAADIMTAAPKIITAGSLAIDALQLMRHHKVSQLIVLKQGQYIGMVHFHDLIREGFSDK